VQKLVWRTPPSCDVRRVTRAFELESRRRLGFLGRSAGETCCSKDYCLNNRRCLILDYTTPNRNAAQVKPSGKSTEQLYRDGISTLRELSKEFRSYAEWFEKLSSAQVELETALTSYRGRSAGRIGLGARTAW
jgi:hypothetical protein